MKENKEVAYEMLFWNVLALTCVFTTANKSTVTVNSAQSTQFALVFFPIAATYVKERAINSSWDALKL